MLDQNRRREIERLLLLRGRLLAPRPQTIARSLRRCVKHAAQEDDGQWDHDGSDDEGSEDTAPATVGSSDDAFTVPVSDSDGLAPSASEELRIASAVAEAVTVSETSAEEDFDFGDPARAGTGLIPAMIRRGNTTVKGLAAGSTIKGYRIEGILGIGGMGQVYQALQMSMNRRVAFKILSPRLGKNKSFRERFLREARNAGRLQHPNLISVHDVDEAEGLLFFSMELVDGQTIKQVIKQDGMLSEQRALQIIRHCLEGLSYAHTQGLVHRDIKPDNIMLTKTGQVKIADLGLSRLQEARDESGVTNAGSLMGTPHYMAPEQSRDAHAVDQRADLYAVGATLYHMVCGRAPFPGSNTMDVLVRAATQPLTFPEDGPAEPMRQLISYLMAKAPEDRPDSASAALTLVDDCMTRLGAGYQAAERAQGLAQSRRRRQRWGWLISLVVTGLIAVTAVFLVQANMRTQSWEQHRHEAETHLRHNRYHQATQSLERYLEQPASHYRADAQEMREAVLSAWNEHTRLTYAGFLARVDDLIFAERYAEARLEMARFREDLAKMSPWMQRRFAELDEQLGDADEAEAAE